VLQGCARDTCLADLQTPYNLSAQMTHCHYDVTVYAETQQCKVLIGTPQASPMGPARARATGGEPVSGLCAGTDLALL
jgi:hypothetical protein